MAQPRVTKISTGEFTVSPNSKVFQAAETGEDFLIEANDSQLTLPDDTVIEANNELVINSADYPGGLQGIVVLAVIKYVLTFSFIGDIDPGDEPIIADVDGVDLIDNKIEIPAGETFNATSIFVDGYSCDPDTLSILMDSDKTVEITLTPAATDPNLFLGATYEDPTILTGTPPIIESEIPHIFRRIPDGFAQGQPGKRWAIGSESIFKYVAANTLNVDLLLHYQAGNLGNFVGFEFGADGDGIMQVSSGYNGNAINEVFPVVTPILDGQFLSVKWISGTSTRIYRLSVIAADKTTVIFTKDYTVFWNISDDTVTGYTIYNFSTRLNYPQSKGMTNY